MATFRKRHNKWEYRISYKDPFTQKNRLKSKGGFSTKAEAKHAAKQMEKLLDGGFEMTPDTPLAHFLKQWLELVRQPPNVSKNTYKLDLYNINDHIIPYYQEITIQTLGPLEHQKFVNHMRDQGYSQRTTELAHTTLHNALSYAIKPLKLIHENPCDGVTIRKDEAGMPEVKKLEYMDSSYIPLFWETALQDNYIYYMFFRMITETGLRKGEAAALQITDFELDKNLVHITKSLDFQPEPDEDVLGSTKTYTSQRTLTIRQTFSDVLKGHMEWIEENKRIMGDLYRRDLNLMFCKRDGSPLPKSTLFNALVRILDKAGIPQIPIHALRDTHAVMLLESGAKLPYIQKRLGHKDYKITVERYLHISQKIEQSSIDGYDKHIEKLLEI